MNALILIDVQQAFFDPKWGKRNNPLAEQNMLCLLDFFRQQKLRVIHIQHISDNPLSCFHITTGQGFKQGFTPQINEKVFRKRVNSAFIGTDLEQYLKQQGITDLTIVGLTLPHCVSTTTRMASNLGFNVTLIEDATASFPLKMPNGEEISAEDIHKINIATLNDEFATILSTAEFLEKLNR
ncbi:cysteine hydrolase family protein [Frederiksenia canicola]|uniref:Isochorismatase n=1 Tax=Frederiksenia canicola TaxID=123824 RepID=A0AAE6X863_9PAST|nr:cysteine hydrolase family protein [Frederiksenia canicola]QIM65636.1 isochorismatase [Frederiksenia canicola]RPE95906.1 nicotinamidase-related amidase [Frederiksenia canicola]